MQPFGHLFWSLLLLFIATFLALYWYFAYTFTYWKKRNIPFIKPVPFIGNFRDLILMKTNIGMALKTIHDQTKEPFIGVFALNKPYLVINDPELLKTLFVKDFNYFNDHIVSANERDDPIGSKILYMLKNPAWKIVRHKVAPALSTGKIRDMFSLMVEVGSDLKSFLEENCGKRLETHDLCGRYATDIISSCAFGIEAHSFTNNNAQFNKMAARIFNWDDLRVTLSLMCNFLMPSLLKTFKLGFIEPVAAKFFRKSFWKAMLEREETEYTRNDFMDLLIKIKNEKLEADDIKLGKRISIQNYKI